MSSVPVSIEELEEIVSNCARDLLEKWAIEGEVQEQSMPQYAAMAAETAAFVIEKFMDNLNSVMEWRAVENGIIREN